MFQATDDIYLQRWLSLLEILPANDKCKREAYDELRLHYAESHRAYHTFEHIKACLAHLDKVAFSLENAVDIELALWFHDIIYDSKSTTNELDSALYASQQLKKLGLSQAVIKKVHHLIMLTQHRSNPQPFDEKMLVDIDLSILGAEPVIFSEYERNIRQEYHWVDEKEYQLERGKVLSGFLDQASIYQTSHFFESREKPARRNIKSALQNL